MRMKAAIVPGFFTMANMFCGYYSVTMAAKGEFTTAAWLIIAAGVLDVLDGKLARMVQGSSEFGVQYDSLADVVSFGLAPSVLGYYAFFQSWGTIGLLLSFMPLVFGSIRLARFNVRQKGFTKNVFEGVPIPAAAVAICSYILINYELWDQLRWPNIFLLIVLVVSFLMITNIRYEVMPNFSLQSSRKERLKILAVLVAVVLILVDPQKTIFPLILIYIFSGPARAIWLLLNTKNDLPQVPETKEKRK